jgi:hypothetical protein
MRHEDEVSCGCKIIEKEGDLYIQWVWPCKGHGPGYRCEAAEYLDSYKTHGCIKIKCKACSAEYCMHYPKCPRCLFRELKAGEISDE